MNIEEPLRTFYHRLHSYRIGDSNLYLNAIKNSKEKFCFNSYIATECDVQVKLGGILEEYFFSNQVPYSVNSEMKIYSNKNEKADLTIHHVTEETLYTEIGSPKRNLIAAFEIKYANAVHPNFEYVADLIIPDLRKLESLPKEVKKSFCFYR